MYFRGLRSCVVVAGGVGSKALGVERRGSEGRFFLPLLTELLRQSWEGERALAPEAGLRNASRTLAARILATLARQVGGAEWVGVGLTAWRAGGGSEWRALPEVE